MADSIKIKTKEGTIFTLPKNVALMCNQIKTAIENAEGDDIDLQNLGAAEMGKVVEWLNKHFEFDHAPARNEAEVKAYDEGFFDSLNVEGDKTLIFQTVLAANFLDIKPLVDLICAGIAKLLKGKKPEQIRAEFGIKNDFTPEEEKRIRAETAWLYK